MSKLKACVAVGVVGAVGCSILAGVSFSSIQAFLFQLDLVALALRPLFYSFLFSVVGFVGFVGFAFKAPVPSNSDASNLPPPPQTRSRFSEKESGVSSGASGAVITLLPGTKLQNESGTTLELAEHYIMWPKIAASEVPEEIKKPEKKVDAPRFFKRVERRN